MRVGEALARAPKYVAGAILIALIEEGFFRAFLLGGMIEDFGRTGALVLSSVVYALAHLVRSPARFYLTGYDATAGFHNLYASLAQLTHPAAALPALVGLFLLGLALGEAFLVTGNVYFFDGTACRLGGRRKAMALWRYTRRFAIAMDCRLWTAADHQRHGGLVDSTGHPGPRAATHRPLRLIGRFPTTHAAWDSLGLCLLGTDV